MHPDEVALEIKIPLAVPAAFIVAGPGFRQLTVPGEQIGRQKTDDFHQRWLAIPRSW